MKIEISKEQYQRVLYKLLDMLCGPNLLVNDDRDDGVQDILSYDDKIVVFRVYNKSGRAKGCKKDLLVLDEIADEIKEYVPLAVLRKKLFSKTVLSYVNEKTNLNIDCIEFWYPKITKGKVQLNRGYKYNFNVKKNKRLNT